MITREKLAEEIKKVPDRHLEQIYRVIKDLEATEEETERGQSVNGATARHQNIGTRRLLNQSDPLRSGERECQIESLSIRLS